LDPKGFPSRGIDVSCPPPRCMTS